MRRLLVLMLAFQGVFSSPVQPARGAHIAAQCQARCYQLVHDAAQQEAGASEAEPDTWRCEDARDDVAPCDQCLRGLNVTKSGCVEICKTGFADCKDSCPCLLHNKVANVMDPPVPALEVADSAVQLLCRDVFLDGASLVLRLVPDPTTTQPVVLVAEVRSQGGQWTEALISDNSTLALRGLQFEEEYYVRLSAYGARGLLVAAEAGPFVTLERDHKPTAVRELHVAGVRLDPEHPGLLLNVTWQPAADNVCCHTITRRKPPSFEDAKVCEPGRHWVSVHRVEPGEVVDVIIRAQTSIPGREHESRHQGLERYTVPTCPLFAGTRAQLLKYCRPPTLSDLCSLESASQGSRQERLDLQLTWSVPALPAHAPRILFYRVQVRRNRDVVTTSSVPASYPERQGNSSKVTFVLRDVQVPRGQGYEVEVQAETELGVGRWTTLKRRVQTTARSSTQRQNAEGSFFGGDCQSSVPIPSQLPPHRHPISSPRPPPSIHPGASTDMPWGVQRGVAGGAVSATMVAAGAATLVLVLAGVVAWAAKRYSQWRRRRVKRLQSRTRYEPDGKERCRKSSQASSEYEPLKCDLPASPKAMPEAVPETVPEAGGELHVSREGLRLGAVLGEGAFGVVRRAEMRRNPCDPWQTVAVKMLKEEAASSEDRRQLLREIGLMKAVGRHPHLVCMLACSGPREPAPFLVVEHCERGDLQHFLRQQWHRQAARTPPLEDAADIVVNKAYGYQNDSPEKTAEGKDDLLSPAELLSIARQVALGMEFLSGNRVVHRDLAARNVLVTAERSVKIADFGLSRDVYEQNVYRKTSEGRLPIKWMALESLLHQVYTSASDVWSFGILLWEIVTLGGTPYPGIATGRVFPLLRSGYRMERPDNCSQQLYDVMLSCWDAKPSDRPAFPQLREQIEEILETCGTAGPYLPLQQDGSGSSGEETSLSDPTPVDPNYLQPLTGSSEEDTAHDH